MVRNAQPPLLGDRGFAIDALAIAIVSVAVCLGAQRLAWMSALVPAVIVLRTVALTGLKRDERLLSPGWDLALVLVLAAIGGFNDHSSVCRHRIYDYTVPAYFPELSTIPLWMLLYWGLILRFVISLTRWRRLEPSPPTDEVHLGGRVLRSVGLKLAIQLGIVLVTRQLIYRLYDHPLWSWLPFALGLAAYFALLRPKANERRLALLFGVGGPLVEVLYIQVGGLHRYALGWLGGVPLWIALWWVLGMLIVGDLAGRALAASASRARASSARNAIDSTVAPPNTQP